MGVRLGSVATTAFIGPLPATNAETIVFTTPPLTLPIDNAQVLLIWQCCITPQTGTANLSYHLRRGPLLTSPLVNINAQQAGQASGNSSVVSGVYVDSPGAAGGVQYTLTVIQNTATVAGAFNDGCLYACVL